MSIKTEKIPDLEVQPFKTDDKPNKKILNGLPKPPFVAGFIGSRGSGKSTASYRLIALYQRTNYFDKIFMINPSYFNDEKAQQLGISEDDVYIHPNQETISELDDYMKTELEDYKSKKEYIRVYRKLVRSNQALTNSELMMLERHAFKPPDDLPQHEPNFLLICDDCVASDLLKNGKNPFNHFLMLSRHRRCSIILNVQYFKSPGLPRAIRDNLTFICVFKSHDKKSITELSEEVAGVVTAEKFLQLYTFATKEPHDFLFIDLVNRKDKFRKNFDEIISID